MQVVFNKQFKFSANGIDVVTYVAGAEPQEVSDECAAIALELGHAEKAVGPTQNKAAKPPKAK